MKSDLQSWFKMLPLTVPYSVALVKVLSIIIPCNEMKIFDWLIRIQHLECYCQQIYQSTTSDFTTMNSNVKERKGKMANTTDAQRHQMLYLQMQVTLQMLHLRALIMLK